MYQIRADLIPSILELVIIGFWWHNCIFDEVTKHNQMDNKPPALSNTVSIMQFSNDQI